MAHFDVHDLPEELREVEARLREARPCLSALELDEFKLRAMAASSKRKSSVVGRMRGAHVRNRVLTLVLTAMLLGGTTAGGIAASGSGGNSASNQYKHCVKHPTPKCP